ncbi:hypothetical protein [Muricoccus radiodurans]|uniref:hypothetical protein n=1 Tax=Muricoccus radiodurans TaxID=2231721 RepID=UPI003CFB50BA
MPSIEGLFTNTREFLKQNLLIMLGTMPTTAGMHAFAFEDGAAAEQKASRKSKFFWKSDYDIQVWNVRWVQGNRGGVPAFWLPYAPNTKQRSIARKDAPFLLTASMTGCSFGAVDRPGLGLEVNHVNYQTMDGVLDESRMKGEIAHCTHRLHQDKYRERARGKAITDIGKQAVMGATVVGVNTPRGGWKLWAQQWENTDGVRYVYHELLDL